MSNTITLTVELGPKTQEKLDKILEALQKAGGHNCHSCVETEVAMTKDMAAAATEATAPQPAQDTPAPDITHPADVVSPHGTPEPVAEPEPEAPKWTKDALTKKVQALAAPGTGKREKVRAIVKSYAEKVGDIPEDKYAEVMDKLTALEQEG